MRIPENNCSLPAKSAVGACRRCFCCSSCCFDSSNQHDSSPEQKPGGRTASAVSLLCHCWFVLTWQADVEKHRGQQSARSLYLPLVNRRTPLSATHIHPRVYTEDDQSTHMLHFQRQSELQVKTPSAPLHVSWCQEPLHQEYNTILMNNVFLNTDFSFPHTRGFF